MSKINAVRFINLNYNNNAIHVSDEIFHLNGDSTLLSLRNGGGKSVLVQMMTAPFVHKRYRDAKDRPFESYFTTSKPSFILVEWVLDRGAGYVLTGMMVRRSQESTEEQTDSLEMINFISEYRERCQQDIYRLPVLEKNRKEILLKGFGVCRQLFEGFKRDRSMHFTYYDMNQMSQARAYFEKLKEYQIHSKEWETIIKKINLKESGLSDLFADCKDEKGLVEKWLLEAVESKLNKERSRMKEFQNILEKYTGQYKDNRSKIERRDTIRKFTQEASAIEQEALNCLKTGEQIREQEGKIVCFWHKLEELEKRTAEQAAELEREKAEKLEEIRRVEYEETSAKIHALIKEEKFYLASRDMIGMERDEVAQEIASLEEKCRLYQCARQKEKVQETFEEYRSAVQNLEFTRKRKEDLEPERIRLKKALEQFYAEQQKRKLAEEAKTGEHIRELENNIREEKERREQINGQLMENSVQHGKYSAMIRTYDEKESSFNAVYAANLTRNILGDYEPGELEITGRKCKMRLEEATRQKTAAYRKKMELEESQKSLSAGLEKSKDVLSDLEIRKKEATLQMEEAEREIRERKVILKYLELPEKLLFDKSQILETALSKLKQIEVSRRSLQKEEDKLQKEYVRLTQGKVLELPEAFSELLKKQGITWVYGMEYLQRNTNSFEQNQELVREHPFLPYALIMSEKELQKLLAAPEQVYTSFPVPIVIRESLDQKGQTGEKGMVRFPQVSFYLLFNENLLDEKKLAELVSEKEIQIQNLGAAVKRKTEEYEEYFSKKEKIESQKLTESGYQAVKECLRVLEEEQEEQKKRIREGKEKLNTLIGDLQKAVSQILKLEQTESQMQHCLREFEALQEAYEDYLENCRQLTKWKEEERRLTDRKKMIYLKLERLEENVKSENALLERLVRDLEKIKEKCILYRISEEERQNEVLEEQDLLSEENVVEQEARYTALTQKISAEQSYLEQQVQNAATRWEREKGELVDLQKRYRVKEEQFQKIRYSRKEEIHLEDLTLQKQKQKEEKDRLWNTENTRAEVAAAGKKEKLADLKEKFRAEAPLKEEEIHITDFAGKIREVKYEIQMLEERIKALERKLAAYSGNMDALAEYSDLVQNTDIPADAIEMEQTDFASMTAEELRRYLGILLRDYKNGQKELQKGRDSLLQILSRLIRREEFRDDFYRKPLEAMTALSTDAACLLEQLQTTLQSYGRLMEKLEVDISLLEKEKERILELLEEYLIQVHENLGSIDHNSTITIREKPVKMLRIQVPDWEENAGLYHIRLQDFVEELAAKGVEIFEKNENAQEYFGVRLTTRSLYDRVVGIGNVQIRLYKIEEQREYPITWAEVARNSGGEGFLSAFVILSSLLYYMRRDETDIFGDRNEGKVLLMDNPFAQTNAAHLLKPLMEMAKKTNTQLICLTGLGGESIYNCFDNIYVLNLIAASLRGGMQYLKGNHTKGIEPQTMILSRIQVMEQQELIF